MQYRDSEPTYEARRRVLLELLEGVRYRPYIDTEALLLKDMDNQSLKSLSKQARRGEDGSSTSLYGGAMLIANVRMTSGWLRMVLLACLVWINPNQSVVFAAGADSPKTIKVEMHAETFSLFVRNFEWKIDENSTDHGQCKSIFSELGEAREERWIQPTVVTSNANDQAFSKLSSGALSVSARAVKARREEGFQDARTIFPSPRSIGDRNYQLYEVALAGAKPWTVLYGEYEEEKLKLSSYFDGYRTLDVFVVVGSEQFSGRYNQASVRQLRAWRLENGGNFKLQCIWRPSKSAAYRERN